MDYARYPSLADKTALITGGASGIGAAFVEAFHEQNARVSFIDRDAAAGAALVQRLPGVTFLQCDVTDGDRFQQMITDGAPFSILINNVANDTRQNTASLEVNDIKNGFAINLEPAVLASVAVYRGMVSAGGGAIINISSINALLAPAKLAIYNAAKAGLIALTKSLAREWGGDNIRVNAISPGWVATTRQLALWLTPEAEADWMKQVSLQHRIESADVARLALFLAADDSAMITGQNFIIDGGRV